MLNLEPKAKCFAQIQESSKFIEISLKLMVNPKGIWCQLCMKIRSPRKWLTARISLKDLAILLKVLSTYCDL